MHYITILQEIIFSYIKKFAFWVVVVLVIYGGIASYTRTAYSSESSDRFARVYNHHQSPESVDMTGRDLECIVKTVYGEARGESMKGQLMVANVIMNRVLSNKYPNSICDVVKQKNQFSVWNNGNFSITHRNTYYDIEKNIIGLFEDYYDLTNGAMWYHADYVNPKWRSDVKQVAHVGKHIFYKEKED